jgi:DNA-binding FrmR family transcriptional regulator
MKSQSPHHHHDDISRRLKRAAGHLHKIIDMIDEERSCLELAQQLQAVEKAISQAKKTLIHDHIDHCLEDGSKADIKEFKEITKYL